MQRILPLVALLSSCALAVSAIEAPEKVLNRLLKENSGKATRVDGAIVAAKTLKVSGVIHGTESDLTITPQGGRPGRTIILKGKSWTSVDDTTWQVAKEIDRSFAKLIMGPLLYNGEATPPFVEEDRTAEKDGTVIQHISLKVPKEDAAVERPHYWIAWEHGTPVEIRRAEVPLLMGEHTITIKAEYHTITELPAVKAPSSLGKKTAEATNAPAPETLLAIAKKNMASHTAWKFSATVDARETMKLTGTLEGQNCDLTLSVASDGDAGFRQKLIGKTQYASTDGGKSWQTAEAERDLFHLVNTPIRSREQEKIPPFEIVESKEAAEGITILHIRFKSPQAVQNEGDRPNYWIVLTDGKPTAVLRYHGPMGFQGRYVTGRVDYEPADLNQNGEPLIREPASL